MKQNFQEFRKLFIVPAATPLRFAGEAGHPLSDVRLESHSLLFAIIADVDTGSGLLFHNMTHSLIHGLPKLSLVDRQSLFAPHEKIGKLVVAWKTSDVCHQNAFLACDHNCSTWRAGIALLVIGSLGRWTTAFDNGHVTRDV